MRVVCVGLSPAKFGRAIANLSAAAAVLVLAGCASDTPPNHVAGPIAQRAVQKVEIEADGAPVQPPPVRRMRPDEDDPTQPWSPNYGNGSAASPAPAAPVTRPTHEVDAAVAVPMHPMLGHDDDSAAAPVSVGTITNLTEAESDAIVAEAISVHEMRRQ